MLDTVETRSKRFERSAARTAAPCKGALLPLLTRCSLHATPTGSRRAAADAQGCHHPADSPGEVPFTPVQQGAFRMNLNTYTSLLLQNMGNSDGDNLKVDGADLQNVGSSWQHVSSRGRPPCLHCQQMHEHLCLHEQIQGLLLTAHTNSLEFKGWKAEAHRP
jgi:hypothetical protein